MPVLDVAASPGLPSVLSTVLSTIGHAKEGEPAASTPWSPEVRREFEQKAREMRLYAAGLEVLDGRYLRRCE
jgi:hypothetical protein